MPFLIVCAHCSARMKSAQPVPAGRTINCPQCKTPFTLTAPAPETEGAFPGQPPTSEVARAPTAEAPASAKSRPSAPPLPPQPRSRREESDDDDDRPVVRSRRRKEPDDDDRPRTRRRDDDDRPRPRRQRDDDDDRPPVRRHDDDDDDDDDRPRSRKYRDDEDDRPRVRKARNRVSDPDDDDQEDDRPHSRRRKKGKSKVLLFAMIGGAAFLVLIGLGVLLVVWDPLRMFRGAPDDMLSWMPGDTRAVEYVDVRAVHKYAAPRRKLETQFGYLDQMGVKLEEVDAVMAGGAARGLPRQTFVVQLSNPADRDQIIRQSGGQSVSAAGKEYYRTNSGMGLHFASDRLLVLTSNHTAMPRVLEQRGGADLPADLKEATGRAHGHIWDVQAIPGNPLGGPGRGADMFGIGSIPSPRYQVNSATFLGGEVKSESLLEFQDATSAQRAGEVFERILGMVRGMGGMPVPGNGRDRMRALESARVEVSGPTVTITNTSPVEGADNVTLPFPF